MLPFIPMQWQLLAKFLLLLAVAASAAFGAWRGTSDHYLAEINALNAANSNAVNAELMRQQKQVAERAEQTKLAEEQHAQDQLVINRLGNQLAGVRVKLPTVGCDSVSGAGQTTSDSNGTSRILYQRVDAAFARLQTGVGQLIQRCDQINIDAIEANSRTKNEDAVDSAKKTGD